jgi:quinol monooxygenase YgiN
VAEEPGTLAFTFLLDEQDEDRFYALEQYADRAAHHAHSGGPVMQRHGPAIVPLLAGPPVLLTSGDQVER